MACSGNCAPQPQMFQENISGNFNGQSITAWSADPGHYTQGTFEIFNSNSSTAGVQGSVNGTTFTAPSGNTVGRHVQNPTVFNISAGTGMSGSYCITLYKKVLP